MIVDKMCDVQYVSLFPNKFLATGKQILGTVAEAALAYPGLLSTGQF